MRLTLSALAAVAALAGAAHAEPAAPLRSDQVAFRALYKELVETNTTLSSGSCTEAAAKMGARLTAAGFKSSELTYFADRGFYADWWNSISWDQFARDWNRP